MKMHENFGAVSVVDLTKD